MDWGPERLGWWGGGEGGGRERAGEMEAQVQLRWGMGEWLDVGRAKSWLGL